MLRLAKLALIAAIFLAFVARVFSQQQSAAREFRVAISVSPFTEGIFRGGIIFSDGRATASNPAELQRIFAAHGANEIYARIGTRQSKQMGAGDHSMDRGLDRARLAKSLGLPLNPELGLFNVYGDVRCQPPPDFSDYPQIKLPAAWSLLTLSQMQDALRTYGAAAARQILDTGVKVRIWDLGNEVEFGVAGVAVPPMPGGCDDTAGGPGWYKPPDAVDPAIGKTSAIDLMQMPSAKRIAWLEVHIWPYESKLLAAVADGIRTVDSQARFSTHVSGISSVLPDQAVAFFSAMRRGGFSVDECGVSYYPTSSNSPRDRLQAFKDTAQAVHKGLACPIFIAEFGYPSAKMTGVFSWNDAVKDYPLTSEGQANFIRDLVAWGAETEVISGIRPWAPDLVGPGWGPMSLFAREAASPPNTIVARPALNAIAEGLQAASQKPKLKDRL